MTFTTRLSSKTLDNHPRHLAVKRIMSAALEAADPALAVQSTLSKNGNIINIERHSYVLDAFSRVYLIAIGKAAPAMASAARDLLGDALNGGIVVSKHPTGHDLGDLSFYLAGHPLPDNRSLTAGEAILKFLSQRNKNDFILFLISGGGSALITAPVDGITITDLQKLTSLLLGSGARIDEINTLRRALDRVKGGGLAKTAYPAKIASLILSDVVDSPLEAIASGPTVPNPTNSTDAFAILKKYNLLERVPPAIINVLKSEDRTEKEISFGEVFIIGSNQVSASAARDIAIREGFQARILTTSLQGEAAKKGYELARYLLAAKERPLCLIVGGETTVTLGASPGIGGRNQEMALAAVEALNGAQNIMLITLATDGDDGPTDAAGAVVTGKTLKRAKLLKLDPDKYLHTHNAYPFFEALDDLLKPGSTGTNVNDLVFLFAF